MFINEVHSKGMDGWLVWLSVTVHVTGIENMYRRRMHGWSDQLGRVENKWTTFMRSTL